MKKLFLIAAFLIVTVLSVQAQKIGFINTDSVLTVIPDYSKAQDTLKALAKTYRAELESDLQKIDELYTKYQQQKQYLSPASCATREQQIITLENAVKEKQTKYFGDNGQMSKRSEQLLTPIRTKVSSIIKQFSQENGYSAIIDLAAVSGLVYYNETEDITKKIIDKLK